MYDNTYIWNIYTYIAHSFFKNYFIYKSKKTMISYDTSTYCLDLSYPTLLSYCVLIWEHILLLLSTMMQKCRMKLFMISKFTCLSVAMEVFSFLPRSVGCRLLGFANKVIRLPRKTCFWFFFQCKLLSCQKKRIYFLFSWK
jgi:hypothetical protein